MIIMEFIRTMRNEKTSNPKSELIPTNRWESALPGARMKPKSVQCFRRYSNGNHIREMIIGLNPVYLLTLLTSMPKSEKIMPKVSSRQKNV
jgi:hypothetical protein